MSSFFSRLTAAVTVGIGGAMSMGVLNPKTAAWIALGAGVLQAFQHPVTQSTSDNAVAASAITANKANS